MDEVKAGLAIDQTDESLLAQKKAIEDALRDFDARQAASKAAYEQSERDAENRRKQDELEFAKKERERLIRAPHDAMIDRLRVLLTIYDDYWSAADEAERESYIAAIEAQGDRRLKAEIAGREAYWNDRYRSPEEPGTLENEEKKARRFVERELEN